MHAPLARPALRVEDATLLRGRGRFVDDIALPGLLHASFVRSPVAHARLNGIDASAARRAARRARGADLSRPAPAHRLRPHSARAAGGGDPPPCRSVVAGGKGAVLRRRAGGGGGGRKPRRRRGRRQPGRARLRGAAGGDSIRSRRSKPARRKARLDCADNLVAQLGAQVRRRRARLRAAPRTASRSASASTRAAAMRSRPAPCSRASTPARTCSRSGTARRCRTRPSA